jgi:hypothetical protein
MRIPEKADRREEIKSVMRSAEQNQLGVLLYSGPEKIPENVETVEMIIEEPEAGWKIGTDLGKSDLALLISYKLKKNWKSDLILTAALGNDEERKPALDYLKTVAELARIPNAECRTVSLGRENQAGEKPTVKVYSMTGDMDLSSLDSKMESTGQPCLFALDSGFENAFA